jgi:hypothetical protein
VRHIVATVLNVLELLHTRVDIFKVFQHLFEQTSAIAQVAGHFGKHVEELCISGNKADHVSGRSPGTTVKGMLKSTEKYRMVPVIRSNAGSRKREKGRQIWRPVS